MKDSKTPIEGVSVGHQEATHMETASLISDAFGSSEWQRFPFSAGSDLEFFSPIRTIFAFTVAKSHKLDLGFTVEFRTDDSRGPFGNTSFSPTTHAEIHTEIVRLDSNQHGVWYFAKLYPTTMQAIMLVPSSFANQAIRSCR